MAEDPDQLSECTHIYQLIVMPTIDQSNHVSSVYLVPCSAWEVIQLLIVTEN